MASTATTHDKISVEEGRALLDEAARHWLGISREEFIAAWEAGRYREDESLAVQQVAMLLPFGRE
jgi:hypothetical protein